jgi:hypothetical protein
MGSWAENEFGSKTLPPRAYLFAGNSTREKIDAVISSFNKVLFHRHDVYERYLVSGEGGHATVMFQLYGAPIMCDLVTVLKDGNVKEAVFFGYAYGIAQSLRVGDCVVPNQVQTLDGVTARLGAGPYTTPNPKMIETISAVLKQRHIPFQTGKSVSVPATLWHGDETQIDPDAIALELEFAAFCHCSHAAGITAGGLLVISDTKEQGLLEKRPPRDPIMIDAFRAIKEHWEQSGSSGALRT